MKKKGLSFEEKRKRMLTIFKEEPTFFHMKDIEKLSQQKGIVVQSVKEILESLVADNLVDTDRIGASSYYWALPSKTYQVHKNKLDQNLLEIERLNKENEELEKCIKESRLNRVETENRKLKMVELEQETKKLEELMIELEEYKKNDPEKYKNLKNDNKILIQLNEIYTDNILACEQFLRSKDPSIKMLDVFPECAGLGIFD